MTESNDLVSILLTEAANDAGNAACCYAAFGHEYLHGEDLGWLHWTGTHWDRSGAEAAVQRAVIQLLKLRTKTAVDAEKEAIAKAAYPSAKHVRDCLYMFRAQLSTVSASAFDADPDRLNVANGVLDLRNGELAPHDPAQRFTYCVNTPYNPEADDSGWCAFMADTVHGSVDVLSYVQMAVGYSLTGHTREEVLFYVCGPSRSGKGTFTEAMLTLLGRPLAIETDFATFTAKREAGDQGFDLAPLKPARMVFASESNQAESLNAGKVKRLTGGNFITCAHKGRDPFSYRPIFKLWLTSNHPVRADVDDEAAWGRVRVIEFPNGHLGTEDKTLKARFKTPAMLAGILRWAVEGAIAWYGLGERGLDTPAMIASATKQQRDAQDYVQMWIDEACTPAAGTIGAFHLLYGSYAEWCKQNGVLPKAQRGFSLALQAKGYDTGIQRRMGGKKVKCVGGLGNWGGELAPV